MKLLVSKHECLRSSFIDIEGIDGVVIIGDPETEKTEEGEYLVHYLEGDLSDLDDLNFLKKMVNDNDREEITKDMADKLAKLAETVDRVLSNSG